MQFQLEPANYDDAEDDDILPIYSPIQSAVMTLQDYCHGQARAAGWWTDLETGLDKPRNIGEALMLVTTELAEALEGHRKSLHDPHLPKRDNYTVEIADALIRLFDLAGGTCIDLPGAFEEKMQYNARRADHKIENRRLPGGKKV
mgnify:FL=1